MGICCLIFSIDFKPFTLSPASTNLEVATHIASLLQAWVATGLTPAATLTTPLILI